jgi:hypothetical protein
MATKTKLVKTFEQACESLGLDPVNIIPEVSFYPEDSRKAVVAMAKLLIINRALNGDWKPDWNNVEEYKYYPWWNMEKTDDNPSGFGLYCVYYFHLSTSGVGSRLCFQTRSLAEHAAKHFIDLYRDMLTF